jgi:hypothetical protein
MGIFEELPVFRGSTTNVGDGSRHWNRCTVSERPFLADPSQITSKPQRLQWCVTCLFDSKFKRPLPGSCHSNLKRECVLVARRGLEH